MKGRIAQLLLLTTLAFAGMPQSVAQVKEVKFEELEDYFSKTNDTLYVINFWATWCKPCVEELPYFEKLHQQFLNRPIAVLLVSLDFAKNLESKVVPFVRERKLKSQVFFLHQPQGHEWMNTISQKWSGAIPATYIVRNNREEEGFYERSFKSYQALLDVVESHR